MEEFIEQFFHAKDIIPGLLILIVLSYLGFGFYNLKKHNDWHNDSIIMIFVSIILFCCAAGFLFIVLCQFAGMAFNFMKSLYLK